MTATTTWTWTTHVDGTGTVDPALIRTTGFVFSKASSPCGQDDPSVNVENVHVHVLVAVNEDVDVNDNV
ncbi:MAG TPA: hypothetical protein VLT33_39770, partial [Labilithrix sp.]|nr:hypothetical protein [Labilithrix sp.]